MWDVFQQQANIDVYEVQLKQEQDKRTQAETKLSQIQVDVHVVNHSCYVNIRICRAKGNKAFKIKS